VEIVIIALGSVAESPIMIQIGVVSLIALLATVGVYGIVALLVRMDDFGYQLINLNEEENSFSDRVGTVLVAALPKVIKSLGIIGTAALITVAGGIFVHNIDFFHHLFPVLPAIVREVIVGLALGFVVLLIVSLFKKLIGTKKTK
jgi:predicted DNA repair protein MutK